MKQLSILHVSKCFHPEHGGPPAVINSITQLQISEGFSVSYLSEDADYPEVIDALTAYFDTVPNLYSLRPRFIRPLLSRKQIDHLINQHDVIHLHSLWPTTSLYVGLRCIALGRPYVLSAHGNLSDQAMNYKRFKKQIGLLLGYRAVLHGAARFHALTQAERLNFHRVNPTIPTDVIPNGITPRISPAPSRSIITELWPHLSHRSYILFLARLHVEKGPRDLINAFCNIAHLYPDIDLVISGNDDGELEILQQTAVRYSLTNRIHFTGFVSGVVKDALLHHALLFCLPSYHEGFSVAVLEALSWSTPALITDQCHFPSLNQAKAGWICEANQSSLQITLQSILEEPHVCHERGSNARSWVEEHYSWSTLIQDYNRCYQSLLHNEGMAFLNK